MRAVAVPHGLMPQGPLAVLLAEHLRNLVACLEASPDIDGLALAEATASLVAAVVTNSPAALEVARPHALGQGLPRTALFCSVTKQIHGHGQSTT